MMSYRYDFGIPAVDRIIQAGESANWNLNTDLPWDSRVDIELFTQVQCHSLITELPFYKKLSTQQQKEIQLKESVYHMSNLLAGEHKGVTLAAQVLASVPADIPDWVHGTSQLMHDESKHYMALYRYLNEKIGFYYQPHPRLQSVIQSLLEEDAFEIKLFISQVVLEWTATSLMAASLLKNPEPLFGQMLKKIIQDEGRHLAFGRFVTSQVASQGLGRLSDHLDDLLFEATIAIISSFCAIPVWQEYSLSRADCINYAVTDLQQKGVIGFYKKILPMELARYKIYSKRISSCSEQELAQRVIEANITFEPNFEETSHAA